MLALLAAAALWASAASRCAVTGEAFDPCARCVDEADAQARRLVEPGLSSVSHRSWHRLWHESRRNAARARPADWDAWRAEGLVVVDTAAFARQHAEGGELSGEDFLYMHREMVKAARRKWAAAGAACIAGWDALPGYDDPDWPVPVKPPPAGEPADYWRSRHAWIRDNDAKIRDPEYLRSVSLNKLGQDVELFVHNLLHDVYADAHARCRGERDAAPSCDDLRPPWSSPLNRHFWKIHGFVDDFVGLWLGAHGFHEISIDCGGRPACYQWRGTWTGSSHMTAHL